MTKPAGLRLAVILVFLSATGVAAQTTLPIRHVILSSSGLAQIDRDGSVDGKATVTVPVPLDQVDDVLKSLSIFDSKGHVDAVRLPGKEPLAQAFRALPFSAADLNSPEQLLVALKGAEVTITGSRVVHGRIMSVVAVTNKIGENQTETRHRLTILTAEGLESVLLEEAQQIAFADPALKAQLDTALAATLDSHAQDERSIAIDLSGQGSRIVSLSYVVPAPIWKTSYRILLPKNGGKATLQGWAILENMSGGDWDKVDLTIVSGNPVTLHQALYESYYVHRPDIPVQVFGQLNPRADRDTEFPAGAHVPSPAMAPAAPRGTRNGSGALEEIVVTGKRNLASGAEAAASADTGAQVMFRFPEPVSVSAGQSLMVPFVDREVPAERVWLYQPDTDATHPLTALLLTNDGNSGLPAGILTVFDGDGHHFTGDAQFPNLPHGDNRLISYALDQKTTIARTEQSDDVLASVTADRGVLHITRRAIAETIYDIKAPADEARTVIIEQPKREGYDLEDPKGVEATPTQYRFRVSLSAGETRQLRVRLVHPLQETTQIAGMNDDSLLAAISSAKTADNGRASNLLGQIIEKRRKLADIEARIHAIDDNLGRITSDQDRLRSNLANVPKDGDLAKRYLDKLSAQENALGDLSKERDTQEKAQAAAKADLADAIVNAKF